MGNFCKSKRKTNKEKSINLNIFKLAFELENVEFLVKNLSNTT